MFQILSRIALLLSCGLLSLTAQAGITSYVDSIENGSGDLLPLLIDGSIDTRGTWSPERAHFWRQSPPQLLHITLSNADRNAGDNLELRVHTAYSEQYGYQLPKLLSLYGVDLEGSYSFLGEWHYSDFDSTQCERRSLLTQLTTRAKDICDLWLTLNFITSDPQLVLVLHSGSNLIAIDELAVTKSETAPKWVDGTVTASPLAHSIERLVALKNSPAQPLAKSTSVLSTGLVEITPVNAWSASMQDPIEELTLLQGETEFVAFKLDINSEIPDGTCLKASLEPGGPLFLVNSVIAIDGALIPDAWAPIESCVAATAGTTIYLVGKLDGSQFAPGSGRANLTLAVERPQSEAVSIQHQLPIKVVRLSKLSPSALSACLVANPWGYPTDLPVWNSIPATLDLLTDSGINGFFLSPASVAFDLSKDRKRRTKLVELLGHYRDRGLLILYMGMDQKNGFLANSGTAQLDKWIAGIDALMLASGFSNDQWALYPIDEVDQTKVEQFLSIAERIKRVSPSIKVYANPLFSSSRHRQLSPNDISAIWQLADIVQPRLELYLQHRHLYQQLAGTAPSKLWVYDNPSYPAKTEDPVFYRSLPILAAVEGLQGIGYWSISDTRKSSAWNDFDGVRADWSTLYESEGGPVKSRRFLAFEQGLEEACLIKESLASRDPATLGVLRDRLVCNQKRSTGQQHICKSLESLHAQ